MFGDLGSSLLEGNEVDSTDLSCNYPSVVKQFGNGSDGMCIVINNEYCLMTDSNTLDTAVVDFSLRSDLTNINFITIDDGFRFFNCTSHTR